ncbi:hypothetical protein [Bacillus sp. FSL M8-0077]|uniref:hypothetical protein n=1 Tax=Bacillus sp. FSL M8-0077 TaxID=2954556 RepID=UPI0030FD614F
MFEIRYGGNVSTVRTIEELEHILPGGTWISIIFLIIGLGYLLWDDREVIRQFLLNPDKQVKEEIKKTDLK